MSDDPALFCIFASVAVAFVGALIAPLDSASALIAIGFAVALMLLGIGMFVVDFVRDRKRRRL